VTDRVPDAIPWQCGNCGEDTDAEHGDVFTCEDCGEVFPLCPGCSREFTAWKANG